MKARQVDCNMEQYTFTLCVCTSKTKNLAPLGALIRPGLQEERAAGLLHLHKKEMAFLCFHLKSDFFSSKKKHMSRRKIKKYFGHIVFFHFSGT